MHSQCTNKAQQTGSRRNWQRKTDKRNEPVFRPSKQKVKLQKNITG